MPKGGVLTSTVEITPHSLWAPEIGNAKWISYGQTGITPGTAVPADTTAPTMQVFHSFNAGGAGFLNLTVWADDTAAVFLDNALMNNPNFPQPNLSQNICADGPIGCEQKEGGDFLNIAFGAGSHELRFDVYQVGTDSNQSNNPFGLMYTGTASAIPEPGTYALFGSALVCTGIWMRRRKAL